MATSKVAVNKQVNTITAAINDAMDFVIANENGNRSSTKLSALHDFIGRSILAAIRKVAKSYPELDGRKFAVRTQIDPNGEFQIIDEGAFFTHNCDVSFLYDGVLITVAEIKFYLRSFGKNSRNYKATMIGETSNIHHGGARCVQLIFAPDIMPVLGDRKVIKGWESLPTENDNDYQHMMKTWYGSDVLPASDCPDALYIGIFRHPKNAQYAGYRHYDEYRRAYQRSNWKLRADRHQVVDEHYFLNCYNAFTAEVAELTCREVVRQARQLPLVA